MLTPDEIENLVEKTSGFVDERVTTFIDEMQKVLARAVSDLMGYYIETGAFKSPGKVLTSEMISALTRQGLVYDYMKMAGYEQVISGQITASYAALIEQGRELIDALAPDHQWEEAHSQILEAAMNYDFEQFKAMGQEVASTVQRAVYAGVVTGIDKRMLQRDLASILADEDSSMVKHAKTMAQDCFMQFEATLDALLAQEIGTKHWYYSGVKMATSRSFCIQHEGKVFTEETVRAWNSQTWAGKKPGDVHITRGGYNCRHRLLPVSPEWMKANGLEAHDDNHKAE